MTGDSQVDTDAAVDHARKVVSSLAASWHGPPAPATALPFGYSARAAARSLPNAALSSSMGSHASAGGVPAWASATMYPSASATWA